MFSGIWAKVAGVLVMIIGLLGAALLYVIGQRDKARVKTKNVTTKYKVSEATRDAERTIERARTQARTQSAEVQREAQERPASERPTGTLRR